MSELNLFLDSILLCTYEISNPLSFSDVNSFFFGVNQFFERLRLVVIVLLAPLDRLLNLLEFQLDGGKINLWLGLLLEETVA